MKQRKETVDIVGEFVSTVDNSLFIKTITDLGDNKWLIQSCNTSYLFPLFEFVIDDVSYKVLEESFMSNKSLVIESTATLEQGQTIILPELKYYHGTIIATKQELELVKFTKDKFPMVYLLETLSDEFNNVDDSPIDRTSFLRMFFLTETDEENWNTNQHYNYAIVPMRNALYQFVDALDRSPIIGQFDSYEAINHAKFGVNMQEKGHTKRIFNDKLSGVELQINLPIKKSSKCYCS